MRLKNFRKVPIKKENISKMKNVIARLAKTAEAISRQARNSLRNLKRRDSLLRSE